MALRAIEILIYTHLHKPKAVVLLHPCVFGMFRSGGLDQLDPKGDGIRWHFFRSRGDWAGPLRFVRQMQLPIYAGLINF